MAIDVGALRHRVKIQRLATPEVQTPSGEPLATWVDVAERRVAIKPLQGKEFFAAQQVNADVSHLVTLRYDRTLGLRPRDRVLYGERVFDVQSVINVGERSEELQLLAKEVV